MEVQFLGTGAGLPAKFRNTQSFVFNFMQELKECWMFDCGEATQHQILRTNIKPTKITKIFISHLHADHVLGLIGFLSSRSFLLDTNASDVTIYGPVGIKNFIENNMMFTHCSLSYRVEYIEISSEQCIIDNKTVAVFSYPLAHNIECFGYKILFKKQKGSLDANKLKELGIMPGPFYREIKEADTFEFNGKVYNSSEFLSEDKPEKEISIISECTYLLKEDAHHARKNYHLSILDIEKIISQSKVESLYLTHISARYDRNIEKEAIESLRDKCSVKIAHDLEEYSL